MEFNETEFVNFSKKSRADSMSIAPYTSCQMLIALLTLIGNSLILKVYFRYRNLQDSTTTFVINLAFTDLMTGIVMFIVLIMESTGIWQYFYICLGTNLFIIYLVMASQTLILVTTVERYLGICHRENYSTLMTKPMRIILITSAWLLPVPLSIMPLFSLNVWNEAECRFPQALPKWSLMTRSLFLILQTAVEILLYCRILQKARELYSRVRPIRIHGINASTLRCKAIRKSIRNGRIIALVTVFYFASWMPYNIGLLCFSLGTEWMNFTLMHFFRLLGMSSCTVNPFLYAWQRKDIRSMLKKMMKCKTHENGAQRQESANTQIAQLHRVLSLHDMEDSIELHKIEHSKISTTGKVNGANQNTVREQPSFQVSDI